eukprot:SAG31_NODE_4575_length_3124_cov_2.054545_4_plen_93_part_00
MQNALQVIFSILFPLYPQLCVISGNLWNTDIPRFSNAQSTTLIFFLKKQVPSGLTTPFFGFNGTDGLADLHSPCGSACGKAGVDLHWFAICN